MAFISQREAFGQALVELGKDAPNVMVLDADTSSSTMSKLFADAYPDRFVNVGIAEPCLVDVAAGLALGGYTPIVNAFSALLSLRALEEIRTCVAYPHLNVKIAGSYAGLSDYKDGPTHHSIMDIGIMRMLPGLVVIVPADEMEIKQWVPVIAEYEGPVFIRLSRAGSEVVHQKPPKVEIGKGFVLKEGDDVSLICAGAMVSRSLKAAEVLDNEGISACVIEMPCIKPIDQDLILEASAKTGALVTVEEHTILGGLGGAVAEVVMEKQPVPVLRVGISDVFTRTAPDPDSLMDAYGMSIKDIVFACKQALERKKS